MSSRKRPSSVCYIAPDVPIPGPRGSSVHVLELSRSLVKLGYYVCILARRVTSKDPPFESIQGVSVYRTFRRIIKGESPEPKMDNQGNLGKVYFVYLRTLYMLLISVKAVYIIRRFNVGLIIERETAFGAGAIASLLTGRPLILEVVGPRYSWLSVRVAKRILYYTDSMLRNWVPKTKCIKVPAGVDVTAFKPDREVGEGARRRFGFSPKDFVFGYVGTFQKWHGLETVLRAVVGIKNLHPEVRFLLIGPNFNHYKALSANLQLSELCKFTGPVAHQDVPVYINACDAMIALYEPREDPVRRKYGIGFPIKMLEYIACGKPVISTKVEPIANLFDENDGILLVDEGDLGQLRSVMVKLIANRSKFVPDPTLASKFSWDQLGRLISQYIQESIN